MHPTKQTQLVLFDFDGTLCDSYEAAIRGINFYSDHFGYRKVTDDELPSLRNKTSQELLKYMGISLIKLPLIVKTLRTHIEKDMEHLEPYQGISEMLAALKKRGFTLGILTSNSEKNVRTFCEKRKIEDFDFIYSGSSMFGKHKVIKKVLAKKNLAPSQVIYVGDETRDVEACIAAGVKVVAVSWGFNTREILASKRPDYVVDTPQELTQVLGQYSGLNCSVN